MNKFSYQEIKDVIGVIDSNNLNENTIFDFVKIVYVSHITKEIDENTLIFLAYATEEELKDGWYIDSFDFRDKMNEMMDKNPEATFVIEKELVKKVKNKNIKYIVVDSIIDSINSLFNYVKANRKFKTVAVTGSVGKTSCVGLIESVLKEKYNVLRVYSKRITPIILKAYIINLLTPEIEFIVLENSIYYHDHVKILSNLLEPDVGAILNIQSSHLGVEKLDSLESICKYKAEIFNHPEYGFVNDDDEVLSNLKVSNGSLYFDREKLLDNKKLKLIRIGKKDIEITGSSMKIDNDVKIKPYFLSDLSITQYVLAYRIGKLLGLSSAAITRGFKNFVPVENRLAEETYHGKKIIFDGDITTYERMMQLSNNYYKKKVLVLRKVGSAENTFRIADIKNLFYKFDKVYVFKEVEYLDDFKDIENVEVVSDHKFMQKLDTVIIYHYSGYFRVWDKFEEDNLNIYDREKYKIMKDDKLKNVLLLHGWNYRNYTSMTEKTDAWHNRIKFVEELEKICKVHKLSFPGFCGEKEPKKAWNLDDYANYVNDYIKNNNLKIDYIIGYSFGGAVAVKYNRLFNNNQKLILLSPAIIRDAKNSKSFVRTPKIIEPLRNFVRDIYVTYIVKNPYMKYGTKFLRSSYQNIVRIELIDDVKMIDPKLVTIVYGSKDTMVNPKLAMEKLGKEYKNSINVIEGGSHDLANDSTKKLVEIVKKAL